MNSLTSSLAMDCMERVGSNRASAAGSSSAPPARVKAGPVDQLQIQAHLAGGSVVIGEVVECVAAPPQIGVTDPVKWG